MALGSPEQTLERERLSSGELVLDASGYAWPVPEQVTRQGLVRQLCVTQAGPGSGDQ